MLPGDLLTSGHIRTLGDAALRLMMEMKHNGAIETVQVGLTAVAARYATFTTISLRRRDTFASGPACSSSHSSGPSSEF